MKLLKLLAEVKEVEQEILDKYYDEEEDITEEETKLQLLQSQLSVKLRQYIHLIKGKFFENTKTIIDDKIKELQQEKKYLDNSKQRLELALHNYVSNGEGSVEIIDDEGKTEFYVTKDFSVRRSVDEFFVEWVYRRYTLPELSHKEYIFLLDALDRYNSINLEGKKEIGEKLRVKIYEDAKKRVLVTDLPEDHTAIEKSIRPTVKITKTKPKV